MASALPGLMVYQDMQRVDRQTWRRYLFYVDLAVFAVFAISLILLVRHAFLGGQYYNEGNFDQGTDALWYVVADTVFVVASFCWIVYRFFRAQYIVLTRRF